MEKRTKALMMALGGIALGLTLQKQSLACDTGMFCPSSGSDCYCNDDVNDPDSQQQVPSGPPCYHDVNGFLVVDPTGAWCGAGTANVINVDENDPPNNEPTQTSMGISPDSGLCSAFNACPPSGTVLTGTAAPDWKAGLAAAGAGASNPQVRQYVINAISVMSDNMSGFEKALVSCGYNGCDGSGTWQAISYWMVKALNAANYWQYP